MPSFFFFSRSFIAFIRRAFSGVIVFCLVVVAAAVVATDLTDTPELEVGLPALVCGRFTSKVSAGVAGTGIDVISAAVRGFISVFSSLIGCAAFPADLLSALPLLDPLEKSLNPAGMAETGL
jgi:hypothetical protein